MTTYIPFTPSTVSAPQFMPVLDGDTYVVSVRWNLYGQRYFINVYDLSGVRILTTALVTTDSGLTIDSLLWDILSKRVTVTTSIPHGYEIGEVVDLVIAGCSPDAYNGAFQVFITDETTFTYEMDTDPGIATAVGSASFLQNMVAGYFASTLIFRGGQFEVNP
jgi:hypothetical protein